MTVQTVTLIVGWGIALTLSVLHGILLPFWKTDLGWYYFLWPVVLTLTLTPNVIRAIFGDFLGRATLVLVMFVLVVVLLGYGLFLLLKYYFAVRKERGGGA